jgi:hypothetical protein
LGRQMRITMKKEAIKHLILVLMNQKIVDLEYTDAGKSTLCDGSVAKIVHFNVEDICLPTTTKKSNYQVGQFIGNCKNNVI